MAEAARVIDEAPVKQTIARFGVADLTRHGAWLVPRIISVYPHLNERGVATWLRSIMFSNEYYFVATETGVALAQILSEHTLAPKPVVWERFVWVKDKNDKKQIADALQFYDEFARWAKTQQVEVMIIEEMTDVPHEMIKDRLGRIFTRQQQFARL